MKKTFKFILEIFYRKFIIKFQRFKILQMINNNKNVKIILNKIQKFNKRNFNLSNNNKISKKFFSNNNKNNFKIMQFECEKQ